MVRPYIKSCTKVHGIKAREDIVKNVVEKIGYGRWKLISQTLDTLGIYQDRKYKYRHMYDRIMNDDKKPIALTQEQQGYVIKIGVETILQGTEALEKKWRERYGSKRTLDQISGVFGHKIQQFLNQMVTCFCRKKTFLIEQLKGLGSKGTLEKFFRIIEIDCENDPHLLDLRASAIIFRDLFLLYADNRHLSRSEQYAVYAQIGSRRKIERVIDHYQYINILKKISYKGYMNDSEIKDFQHEYLLPKIEDNKRSIVYHKLFLDTNWTHMYNQYMLIHNQQEDNQFIVSFGDDQPKQTQTKNFNNSMDVKFVQRKPILTNNGKIRQFEDNYKPMETYAQSFKKELDNDLNNDNKDNDSELDYELVADIHQIEIEKHHNEIDEFFKQNPKANEQLNKMIKQIKQEIFEQFKRNK